VKRIRLSDLDMDARIDSEQEYERKLRKLQRKMLSIQQVYFHTRRRGVVVFEGWDAAGKGGAIRRVTELLDPRGYKVWPIGAPTQDEQGRHYLYRFWSRLPEPGTIAIFDRSWYGRVLVERVEGLAPTAAWKRAYDEINEFEAMLTDDGVRVAKVFLHITREEQLERFAERVANPHKRYKITPSDLRMHAQWDKYVEAANDMFSRTSVRAAQWRPVPANHKWFARIKVLKWVTGVLGDGVNLEPPPLDPKLHSEARKLLGAKRLAEAAREEGVSE
jgi:polyphosphate kinase 2 (PPK2 family)